MLLEIPTRNDLPSYNQLIQLDGVNYYIFLYFNPRMDNGAGKWFISIADQNQNLLAGPVPVVSTWPLFDRFVELSIPPGMVYAFDTSGQNLDPGQFDLGDRVRLMYLEAGS